MCALIIFFLYSGMIHQYFTGSCEASKGIFFAFIFEIFKYSHNCFWMPVTVLIHGELGSIIDFCLYLNMFISTARTDITTFLLPCGVYVKIGMYLIRILSFFVRKITVTRRVEYTYKLSCYELALWPSMRCFTLFCKRVKGWTF